MSSAPPRTVGDPIALLEEAKTGYLFRDDVEVRWPPGPQTEALRQLREDVIFAVEHIPVDRKRQPIVDEWVRTRTTTTSSPISGSCTP